MCNTIELGLIVSSVNTGDLSRHLRTLFSCAKMY